MGLSDRFDVGGTPANPRESYVELIGIRPDDSRKIYATAFYSRLHYSTNGGDAWDFVKYSDNSPLLIDGDESRGNGGACFAYAPSNNAYLYLGTLHGRLWRTTSGATNPSGWQELSPPYNVMLGLKISSIAVHPTEPNTTFISYAVVGRRAVWRGNVQPDGTMMWADIGGSMPSTSLPLMPVNKLAVDPDNARRIFAATKVGVFITLDGGAWWWPFNEGLPNVSIDDMKLRQRTRTLYVTAYGRGIWGREV